MKIARTSKPAKRAGAARKPTAARTATKRPAARPLAAKRTATKRSAARPSAAKPPATKRSTSRPDLGAPIDGFFAKQPAHLRPILEELRALVEQAAPAAEASIKWGMPCFSVGGTMMCSLGGHKAHVNLVLFGPPGAFADPDGRLSGEGKAGRHLKLSRLDELPREAVRGWVRAAAAHARAKK